MRVPSIGAPFFPMFPTHYKGRLSLPEAGGARGGGGVIVIQARTSRCRSRWSKWLLVSESDGSYIMQRERERRGVAGVSAEVSEARRGEARLPSGRAEQSLSGQRSNPERETSSSSVLAHGRTVRLQIRGLRGVGGGARRGSGGGPVPRGLRTGREVEGARREFHGAERRAGGNEVDLVFVGTGKEGGRRRR